MGSAIKKIVIEVGGVELSLSPEDAKTLRDALNELYPVVKEQYIPYWPYTPSPWRITWGVPEYIPQYTITDRGTSAVNTGLNTSTATYRDDMPIYAILR